ncbi:glycosyltransferase family 4 protein [Frateuria defendens]|uniref:glycosyltransferase family 4 protein n=1 Tax=Frateuria defendens TaxID=2219559 RepID=UPI0013791CC8|nr:glycosyltransferase family 4 protein [Frateuria defendens]
MAAEPSLLRKRLLLVTYYPPERGTGGGLRLLDMYRLLSQEVPGLSLTLLACDHGAGLESDLSSIFERVMTLPPEQFNEGGLHATGLLEERFDAVDLQFLQAGDLVRLFKRCGFPRVVVSPMESHVRGAALALARQQVPFVPTKRWLLGELRVAVRELRAVWSADRVMCVSESDARSLRKLRFWGGVIPIETGVSAVEFGEALRSLPVRLLKEAPTVTFLAYFGSQTNIEALNWYLEYVHPAIKVAVPGYRFRVVGRGLSHLPASADASVDLVGEVDSLVGELCHAWVGIAPALSGAGMRGKINQYAIVGVPCVASTLAGKGFAYKDGHSIRLAENATEFSRACIDLLASIEYNRKVGLVARQVCLREYSWESRLPALREIFAL